MLGRSKQAKEAEEGELSPAPAGDPGPSSGAAKNERPRVCLIDVEHSLAETLKKQGFNCYSGTLGPVVDVPSTSQHAGYKCLPKFDFPPNLHEYDIVIVDLQTPTKSRYVAENHTRKKSKDLEQQYFLSSFPANVFDPRPFSAKVLKNLLRPLMEKESILIVFTAPHEELVYQPVSIRVDGSELRDREKYSLYDFYSALPKGKNINGKDTFVVAPEGEAITALLARHNADAIYTIAFEHPTHWQDNERVKDKNFIPLMTAGPERIVSFARVRQKQQAFFFPQIKDKPAFLSALLEKVLPGIVPPLFPYSTQFAWLSDSRYRLPNEKELSAERERVKAEYRHKLDAIDLENDANRQKHRFLHDLLKESGTALVKAVERFLEWLDFDEVVNVDEANPELQEEDLRVDTGSGLLVIEVKGIGGTSTDSDCSQISKIKNRRSNERGTFDVFALYCVNHQRYLPPESRQNPPFNSTQVQDAQSDKRGLVTTYDLFKLYFNITGGFVGKDDARKALLKFGLVTFPPSVAHCIQGPLEVHHDGHVVISEVQGGIELQRGDHIIMDDAGWYKLSTIEEIQVEGKTVDIVKVGEVGVRLSAPVDKGANLWLKNTRGDATHPITASTTNNEPAAGGSI